jgi:hypothetical protein
VESPQQGGLVESRSAPPESCKASARPATGAIRDYLRNFGAEPVAERVVIEGKVITVGGVSAGIDMALTLAAREAGEDEARALQLVIECDPQPPFDSGSLEKAEPETRQRATEVLTRGVA